MTSLARVRTRALAIASLCALAAISAVPAQADARAKKARLAKNAIWVSPRGDDTKIGSRREPIKSLSIALAHADRLGRRRIYLLPGLHRAFLDTTARRRRVTVTGVPGRGRPRIDGGQISGGTRLRFRGVAFRDFVTISNHPLRRYGQVARSIAFERSDFASVPDNSGTCLMIRNGSAHISVRDSRFHDCRFAITGPHDGITDPSRRRRSRHLRFERNWIGPVRTDAFQFTHWEDVTIRGNVIRRQHDPLGVDHTDAIQITGDAHRVRILDNVISDGGQLLFVQEPFGESTDILIRNNLVYASDNYAIKASGVERLSVLSNTVWGTRWGGLLLRGGVRDATVVNNVLDGYVTTDFPHVARREHNFIRSLQEPPRAGEIVGGDPGFADLSGLDFRLTRFSPLIGAADSSLVVHVARGFERAALGCSLAPVRRVAGRRMRLPACGYAER